MVILKKIKKEDFFILFNSKNLVCYLLSITMFLFDRVSKVKIINHENIENSIFINDYLNFELIWNTGIGFGFLSTDSNLIYNTITTIIGIVIFFLIYLITKVKIYDKILLSLVLGGALGNCYDRFTYFAVPDFIDIHYGNFHWFTFNIADIFITLGIVIFIFKDLLTKNEKKL